MVLFKINGERNSGTRFLERILKVNNFPTYTQIKDGNTNKIYHWKHGIPTDDYKELDKKVVDLFIFRNLEDWLISFFNNPYHLDIILNPNNNFKDFLTLPHKAMYSSKYLQEESVMYINGKVYSKDRNWLDYRTNKTVNDDDNGKTIFQIREYKFNKIMEYKKRNKDVILINLSFIQNKKNLSQFLDFLCDTYIPKLKVSNYICNIRHTKNNSNIKNRTYNTDINKYYDIIESAKNKDIENFINNLTYI